MSIQLHHDNTRFPKREFPLVLICNNVTSPANIGSLFRLADSFGIQKIYFCGSDITIGGKRMERTARSTHKYVAYEVCEDIKTLITSLKSDDYTFYALEITNESVAVDAIDFNTVSKLALVIGDENLGVTEEILSQMKQSVHITMFGNNSSMNVANAAGIAIYEITKQWFQELNKNL